MDEAKCLICGKQPIEVSQNRENGIYYSCPECGPYILGGYITGFLRDGKPIGVRNIRIEDIPKLRSSLFYYLRVILNNHQQTQFVPFITSSSDSGAEHGLNINTALSLYPDNISKRIDMVIQLLGTKIVEIGDQFEIETLGVDNYNPNIYFLPSQETSDIQSRQRNSTLQLLKEMNFIKEETYGSLMRYTFTVKGWERLDYLNRNRRKSSKAFIAMSFSKNKIITDAEATIKRAIARAHYVPMIIKEKEYNNYIMPEIIHEIENSKFVVADLTELKAGVYYEAGYAKALGKEVIFTCHEQDFDKRHFDIAQINTLKWSNTSKKQLEIFEDQLHNRIISTVGENI